MASIWALMLLGLASDPPKTAAVIVESATSATFQSCESAGPDSVSEWKIAGGTDALQASVLRSSKRKRHRLSLSLQSPVQTQTSTQPIGTPTELGD
ncbi:MAG: hypothetical protein JSS02_22800 [Planctomycetes bacterium]|nr:hypothetical protein [Planctomycetota bacterium]